MNEDLNLKNLFWWTYTSQQTLAFICPTIWNEILESLRKKKKRQHFQPSLKDLYLSSLSRH